MTWCTVTANDHDDAPRLKVPMARLKWKHKPRGPWGPGAFKLYEDANVAAAGHFNSRSPMPANKTVSTAMPLPRGARVSGTKTKGTLTTGTSLLELRARVAATSIGITDTKSAISTASAPSGLSPPVLQTQRDTPEPPRASSSLGTIATTRLEDCPWTPTEWTSYIELERWRFKTRKQRVETCPNRLSKDFFLDNKQGVVRLMMSDTFAEGKERTAHWLYGKR